MDKMIIDKIMGIYNEWQNSHIMVIICDSEHIIEINIYKRETNDLVIKFHDTDFEWHGFLISKELKFFEALQAHDEKNCCWEGKDDIPQCSINFNMDVYTNRSKFSNATDKNKWLLEALWIIE